MSNLLGQNANRTRIASATGVAVAHLLIAAALLTGFTLHFEGTAEPRLRLFDVIEPLPPARVDPPVAPPSRAPEEAPAPPNLRAEASPVVAPLSPIPPRNPISAAPVPGAGSTPSAGAADVAGPGTGAGGTGHGNGGGGAGAPATRARLVRGRIRDSDYPHAALRAGIEGTVTVRISVAASGRVSDCAIARSSGSAELDATTCRLIRQRFRYRPAKDTEGRNVPDVAGGTQRWWIPRRG